MKGTRARIPHTKEAMKNLLTKRIASRNLPYFKHAIPLFYLENGDIICKSLLCIEIRIELSNSSVTARTLLLLLELKVFHSSYSLKKSLSAIKEFYLRETTQRKRS